MKINQPACGTNTDAHGLNEHSEGRVWVAFPKNIGKGSIILYKCQWGSTIFGFNCTFINNFPGGPV